MNQPEIEAEIIQISKRLEKIEESIARIEMIIVDQQKPFLNHVEAAAYLGKKPATIYQYTHRRTIPHFKVLGSLYFKRADLDQLIETGRVEAY